jgi:integrase
MARRQALTEKSVRRLPRKSQRYDLPDVGQLGLVLRVPPDPRAPISYVAVARRPKGRQVWRVVGRSHFMTLDEARERAREVVRKIRLNLPLDEVAPASVADVCEKWLELVARERGYRQVKERERLIRRHIMARLGSRPIVDIRRTDVNDLLDHVAKHSGVPSANNVLKNLSAIFSWWQSRGDFRSPIVRGMARGSAIKRDRILSDDEIRALWPVANGFVKFALLSAQRREKLFTMRWADVQGDVWQVATAPREKGTIGAVRLPPLAMTVLRDQPRIVGAPVFGRQHSSALLKIRNDSGVHGFTVHDLRRTARSLLSRARVPTEISELVLGHSIRGIRQVYDRHSYFEEKSHALAHLAQLIENILSPPATNVTALNRSA